MVSLATHPALQAEAKRDPFAPMTDEHKLGVQLHHLLHLDPTAVYHVVGDSTVIYYDSPHAAKALEPGQACRIILAPDGKHRRIGIVNIDPRVWAPGHGTR
jgi:hypothetical protein